MTDHLRIPLVSCTAATAIVLFASSALAQTPSEIEARATGKALYDEGARLMAEGKVAEACPKFEAANRVDPGHIGVLLKLAGCYEAAGKTASAKTAFELAEATAAKASDPRAADAHARAAELAPRVPRLVVTVAPGLQALDGLTVQRDGAPVDRALWSVPAPVDPGEHVITASAPGKRPWLRAVALRERDSQTVEVPELSAEAPPPTLAPPVAPPAVAPPAARPAPAPPLPPPAKTGFWTSRRIAGAVLGGVGIGAAGVGGAFGAIAIQKLSSSNADGHCNGNVCDSTGVGLRSDSITAGNVSTALLVVGGALTVTGIVLLALPARSSETAMVLQPGSLALKGTW